MAALLSSPASRSRRGNRQIQRSAGLPPATGRGQGWPRSSHRRHPAAPEAVGKSKGARASRPRQAAAKDGRAPLVAGIPQPPRQQANPKERGPPARDRPRPRMAALLSSPASRSPRGNRQIQRGAGVPPATGRGQDGRAPLCHGKALGSGAAGARLCQQRIPGAWRSQPGGNQCGLFRLAGKALRRETAVVSRIKPQRGNSR